MAAKKHTKAPSAPLMQRYPNRDDSPRGVPVRPSTAWWKWALFGIVAALLCTAACWLDGALAGVQVLRDVKAWCRENKQDEQERRVIQQAKQAAAAGTHTIGSARRAPGPVPVAASGEQETKAALERLLGVPFQKVRPKWLRNTVHGTGRNLEIDCYNEALGIAVEYSGNQHAEFPNPFHKTPGEFAAQVERDALKRQVCESRGLVFIVVPHTVKRTMIESFLRATLQQRGVQLAESS